MCGIVGVVSKTNNALEYTINGLERLEYRGYDSVGVAFLNNKKINILKEKGRVSKIKEKTNNIFSSLSIGHTRWATHGSPSKTNAHPHKVGKITLVHNGIIDNYLTLKNELIKCGYIFKSKTDTEVACAYIDKLYKDNNDMLKVLSKIRNIFKGSYAFGIINEEEPNKIYALACESPLIVGIGKDCNFIASDVPAILKYTNKYLDITSNEIVIIDSDSVRVYDEKLNKIINNVKEFNSDLESISKNGYETFMLKEIHEESDVVKRTLEEFMNNNISFIDFNKYDNIDIVACGSAYHAGLVGKYYFENYLKIKTNVDIASEYQYKDNFYTDKSLVIIISQSGETADSKKCLIKANECGVDTLSIVNVRGSSIARLSKYVIYTYAGIEIAVATTKAYLAQILTLMLIAYKYSKVEIKDNIIEEIKKLSLLIDNVVNKDYSSIAKLLYKKNDIYFIGRKVDYYICLEASLKLKEISYIHSEAYPSGELKHGTISLINDKTYVFALATCDDIFLKTLSNAKEVKARGGKIILVTNREVDESEYDIKIDIPCVHPLLEPIISVIPFQLIAYEVSKLRKCDIDKPRNLAKSVTVE